MWPLDKIVLEHAINQMRHYMRNWENYYYYFEFTVEEKEQIPAIWCMLVKNNDKIIIVIPQKTNIPRNINETNKEALIQILKTYEQKEFKIYYKNVDYTLIGYLLDFFDYYVNMPDKMEAEDWD